MLSVRCLVLECDCKNRLGGRILHLGCSESVISVLDSREEAIKAADTSGTDEPDIFETLKAHVIEEFHLT